MVLQTVRAQEQVAQTPAGASLRPVARVSARATAVQKTQTQDKYNGGTVQ